VANLDYIVAGYLTSYILSSLLNSSRHLAGLRIPAV